MEWGLGMALYLSEDGRNLSTHSMLKTFRRCPKQAEFKYAKRLKPRRLGTPLKRGKWIHELLEVYHGGGDWQAHHAKLSAQFNELFDEEKDYYGDLPVEIAHLMSSYVWHYKNDPWVIHDVEFQLDCEFPDGSLYRGKIDMLIENEFGLWLVDHKSHRSLPDHGFRLLDAQSALYLWAARENGLKVQGFIWNYIKWKAPTKPKLAYAGTARQRLSTREIETDYPTFAREIKRLRDEEGLEITPEVRQKLEYLKSQRYAHGMPQISPFFRRDILEKDDAMLDRVMAENFHTSLRMHDYDFGQTDMVERVANTSCKFSCSYVDLCTVELLGGNTRPMIKQNYIVGDPNDYYNDRVDADQGGE